MKYLLVCFYSTLRPKKVKKEKKKVSICHCHDNAVAFVCDLRDIGVLVDPNKCKNKFNLLHFIRDLSGTERIKKELNGADVIAVVSHPKGTHAV